MGIYIKNLKLPAHTALVMPVTITKNKDTGKTYISSVSFGPAKYEAENVDDRIIFEKDQLISSLQKEIKKLKEELEKDPELSLEELRDIAKERGYYLAKKPVKKEE